MSHWLIPVLSLFLAPVLLAADSPAPLVVHEWGTFTSLQDETGRTLPGINVDDEPLPPVVHDRMGLPMFNSQTRHSPFSKGFSPCHPQVSMRLETPVLYFHLPPGQTSTTLDVAVDFRGGLLTQFYPNITTATPGELKPDSPITPETFSTVEWKDVSVNAGPSRVLMQSTNAPVWTAPRNVSAAPVTVGKESEQFIFYRGVANLPAPLRAVRDGSTLSLYPQLATDFLFRAPPAGKAKDPKSLAISCAIAPRLDSALAIQSAWLYEVRPDGSAAFNVVPPFSLTGDATKPAAAIPGDLPPDAFAAENLDRLKQSMHAALVADGLYPDEAQALLNTWDHSYFRTPGQRLFFLVPRTWTDHYLPLRLSVPAQTSRTMVARIDLVTPTQRSLLTQMSALPATQIDPLYAQLGRFAAPLLLDQIKQKPTQSLTDFANQRRLSYFSSQAK